MSSTANVELALAAMLEHLMDLTIMLAPLADQEEPDTLGGGAVAFLHGPAAATAKEGTHCAGLYWAEAGTYSADDPTSQVRGLVANLLTIAPHTLAGLDVGDSILAVRALQEALVFAHELAEDVAWKLTRAGAEDVATHA